MVNNNPRALVALDINLSNRLNYAWAYGLLRSLHASGIAVEFLSFTSSSGAFEESVRELGASIIQADTYEDEGSEDSYGNTARFRARQVVGHGKANDYDFVLVQGLSLCRYVAGEKALQSKLWSICDDIPYADTQFTPKSLKELEVISQGSKLLLTSSPATRSQMESTTPSTTSKTRLIPSFDIELDLPSCAETESTSTTFFFDVRTGLSALSTLNLRRFVAEATAMRTPPRFVLSGVEDPENDALTEVLQSTGLGEYPGLNISEDSFFDTAFVNQHSVLIDPSVGSQGEQGILSRIAQNNGIATWWPETATPRLDDFLNGASTESTPSQSAPEAVWTDHFANDLADYSAVPHKDEPVRVLLAGADFKFAGDIVDALVQRDDIDLRVDLFQANAKPQPEKSSKLLPWADVIIAEFSAFNAIWYSQNIQPHQKLIVHLHGYELLQPWIDQLVIDNCDKIVFASEFYKNKAKAMKGWPEERLHVIANSVNSADLARPKDDEARFHIGLVGIVPILKRPDRAVTLMKQLLQADSRYVLHIKGHRPWDYAWEWKKAAHQDAYRAFYESIASDPVLFSRVIFEPFSPDIGNWFHKIGWILSPSYRETFHLSAIEGACSGAIPLAWTREGSKEIIGEEYNFDSTEAIGQFVLATNASPESFMVASKKAQRSVERYGIPAIRAKWLELIFELSESKNASTRDAVSLSNSQEARVISEVEQAATHHDYDAALAILDENIPLTRNSRTEIKDVELYMRGLLGTDEDRLHRFLPTTPEPSHQGKTPRLHLVIEAGIVHDGLTLANVDQYETKLDLPAYFQEEAATVPVNFLNDDVPDLADSFFRSPRFVRFDRAIHFAKTRIIEDSLASGATMLVAFGPWWTALPTMLAADVLGIPVAWIIDNSTTWSTIKLASHQDQTNNYVAHTTKALIDRADIRVATTTAITPETSLSNLDLLVGSNGPINIGIPEVSWAKLVPALLETKKQRLDSVPVELVKSLAELKVAVIGSEEFLRELQSVSPQSFAVDPKRPDDFISGDIDALVINIDDTATPDLVLKTLNKTAVHGNDLTSILDKCRVYGIPSIFRWVRHSVIGSSYFPLARKADHICVTRARGAVALHQLHPIAIRSITPWLPLLPFSDAAAVMFRGAGIAVNPPQLNCQSVASAEGENEDFLGETSEASNIHDMEKLSLESQDSWDANAEQVTVFFPTEEQQYLADFVATQGLPPSVAKFVAYELPSASESLSDVSDLVAATGENLGDGYVCVLKSLSNVPRNYLRSLWLSAGPGTVVRPLFDAEPTTSLAVTRLLENQNAIDYGVLFSTDVLGRYGQDITVISIPMPQHLQ